MIPEKYTWLEKMVLPKMLNEALALYGTTEIPGEESNPVILQLAKEIGLSKHYKNDDTAWCGLFIAGVAKRSGRPIVVNPLWARNWATWGKAGTPAPMLGDVLVFSRGRGPGGHVGLYIAEDNVSFHVLGGNQSNTVNIVRIARSRLIAPRRALYINQPESVARYELDPYGKLSVNEA